MKCSYTRDKVNFTLFNLLIRNVYLLIYAYYLLGLIFQDYSQRQSFFENHPFYKEAVRKDLFINSNFNKPLIIQFWGGKGSILDFTKDQTCNWWKENLKKYIFQNGFDAIWNDNNEYDLEDYDSYSYLNNIKVNSNDLSSYQGLLMSKSSYYATSNYYPKRRNYGKREKKWRLEKDIFQIKTL